MLKLKLNFWNLKKSLNNRSISSSEIKCECKVQRVSVRKFLIASNSSYYKEERKNLQDKLEKSMLKRPTKTQSKQNVLSYSAMLNSTESHNLVSLVFGFNV